MTLEIYANPYKHLTRRGLVFSRMSFVMITKWRRVLPRSHVVINKSNNLIAPCVGYNANVHLRLNLNR